MALTDTEIAERLSDLSHKKAALLALIFIPALFFFDTGDERTFAITIATVVYLFVWLQFRSVTKAPLVWAIFAAQYLLILSGYAWLLEGYVREGGSYGWGQALGFPLFFIAFYTMWWTARRFG